MARPKGRIGHECDTKDGELVCKRVLKHEDGTKTTLASAGKRVDGQCNPISTHMSGEAEHLDKLHEFMDKRVKVGCKVKEEKNVPDDY